MAVCSLYEIPSFLNLCPRNPGYFPVYNNCSAQKACFSLTIGRAYHFCVVASQDTPGSRSEDARKVRNIFVQTLPVHALRRNRTGVPGIRARLGVVVPLTRIPGGPYADKKRKINSHITEIFLKQFTQFLPQFVFWKDAYSIYLGCNQRYAELVGLSSPDAIVGKSDGDLPWQPGGNTAVFFRQGDLETLSGKPIVNQEETLVLPNGQKITALVSKLPIRNDNGEALGIVECFSDITELKEKERELQAAKQQAEAANQAKSAFIANISHDIRTPLSGLVGFAEIAASRLQAPNQQEDLQYLVQAGYALLSLLNKVIEFSRLECGALPHSELKFNLAELIDHVLALERPSAAARKLALTVTVDKRIPAYLIGDSVRLHRILLNLISNAVKFTHTGFVGLTAELAQQRSRELILKLVIQDSGVGIPADQQALIFSRFTRLIPSYQGQYPGSGLGLAVVKQFINDLQGEIYVESKEQHGSIFTCLIPCRQALIPDAENSVKITRSH